MLLTNTPGTTFLNFEGHIFSHMLTNLNDQWYNHTIQNNSVDVCL